MEEAFPDFDAFKRIRDFVNQKDSHYCVYIWYIKREKDIKIPFYVGKGKKERANRITNRSPEFLFFLNNFDCDFKIVSEGLTEVEALKKENDLILGLREKGIKLVNKKFSADSRSIF